MARPSKKAERRSEIIDAFERCVVRYGVEGATLQRVADESGLARPLIHHNVGNRDDLLTALLERLVAQEEEIDRGFQALLPAEGRCQAMLDVLFDPRYASGSHDVLLYQALLVAAQEQPRVKQVLLRWQDSFLEMTSCELAAEHPRAEPAAIRAVALGIVALYFNADAMAPLTGKSTLFVESKAAAQRLMETLSWNG